MATRNERVVLTLDDRFTPGIARAAAGTALLQRELDKLDGTNIRATRSAKALTSDTDGIGAFGPKSERVGADINKLSGRLSLLVSAAGALGPAIAPLGGVGAGSLVALGNGLAAAGIAAGTAILAFHGIGDALKAINTAQLVPTAANLAKVQETLAQLPPAAQAFARQLAALTPTLDHLRDSAASGLFPGLSVALADIQTRVPEVERILHRVGEVLGGLAADGAQSLQSTQWHDFFEFLRTDAVHTLAAMGRALGAVVQGFASLWQAFAPLNDSMSLWLLKVSREFADWAANLDKTQGFQDFLSYIQETGPEVGQLLGAVANAFIQIAQAAAPIGGPVLHVLTQLANVVAAIADSSLGTPLMAVFAAMSAVRLATFGYQKAATSTFGGPLIRQIRATQAAITGVTSATDRARLSTTQLAAVERGRLLTIGKTVAVAGGLALATTGAADKLHIANTASLALAGSLYGPEGAVAGGVIGGFLDLTSALKSSSSEIQQYVENVQKAAGPNPLDQIKALQSGLRDAQGQYASDHPIPGLPNFFSDSGDKVKGFQSAIAALQNQQDMQTASEYASVQATIRSDSAMQDYSRSIYANIAAMKARREENNRAFSAETAYHAALLDSRDAVKKNGATLNENTRAGLANREALESQASAWNALSDTAKATPGAFRAAKQALYETARQMGASKDQAHAYVRQLLQIPSKINTQIHLDTLAAQGALNSFYRTWDGRVIHMRGEVGMAGHMPVARASGGPVYGAGTGMSDSIPAWLSNGEFVMRAAAVQKYGLHMMHNMNEMRLANGGWASRQAASYSNTYNTYNSGSGSDGPAAAYFSDDAVKFMTAAVVAAIQRDATQLSAGRRSSGV